MPCVCYVWFRKCCNIRTDLNCFYHFSYCYYDSSDNFVRNANNHWKDIFFYPIKDEALVKNFFISGLSINRFLNNSITNKIRFWNPNNNEYVHITNEVHITNLEKVFPERVIGSFCSLCIIVLLISLIYLTVQFVQFNLN